MAFQVSSLFLFGLALSPAAEALNPDIITDTNRDDVADIPGILDVGGKDIWVDARRATFFRNIADSQCRLYAADVTGPSLSNVELAFCNDASGNTAVASEYLAPLQACPLSATNTAIGHSHASFPGERAPQVRIIWKQGPSKCTYIDPELRFNSSTLGAGLWLDTYSGHLVAIASI